MEQMKEQKKMGRTIRVHIYGMLKLVEYLRMDRHPVFSLEEAGRAHQTLQNYAASLRTAVQFEQQERKRVAQTEVEKLIPILANYPSTPHHEKAKSILAKAVGTEYLTQDDYMDMRAYLITLLLGKSGHRTGVITNCLLSEYNDANKSGTDYQISVSNHKTGRSGAAILTIPNETWQELSTYVFWRTKFIPDGTYLFPTRNGTQMQSNNILRCLERALSIKTTVNTIRQLHVVIADEQGASPQQMNILAKHMGHQLKTQQQYYDVSSKKRKSAEATSEMAARLEKYTQKVCI